MFFFLLLTCIDLKPIEDLVVYKKSLKNRMVGFRWSYSQDTNLDGFIVSFDENLLINTKTATIIPPQKCSAWPEYYCHTFYNLSPSSNYTFKVRIAANNGIFSRHYIICTVLC